MPLKILPLAFALTLAAALPLRAQFLLVPMDNTQTDHLKAYGVAYRVITQGTEVDWLLNYRGGSFAFRHNGAFEKDLMLRNVKYELITTARYNQILSEITSESTNMDAVKLEKAPRIAVYSPQAAPGELKNAQPWDDAVNLALNYAEIEYDVLYDSEIMDGKLIEYDWLHLHHEDFTGQYGRFWSNYRSAAWYRVQERENMATAQKYGFNKVSKLKLAVAQKIKEFVANGGFMFAMCSATDSYDIALAAAGTDICDYMFDGDPPDPNAQNKLDFSQTLAFHNFKLEQNPSVYEYSNVDASNTRKVPMNLDYFTLFEFSAKWDPVPTMLCQNHTTVVKGFMGQTTSYRKECIKPEVLVMGELKSAGEARYIHGDLGRGMWTFYGGHDPEDYQHVVYEHETDLSLYPNSPGYRLILNNVLFPAARKKKQKT